MEPTPDDEQLPVDPEPRRGGRAVLWATVAAVVLVAAAVLVAVNLSGNSGSSSDSVEKLDQNGTEPPGAVKPDSSKVGEPVPAASFEMFDGSTGSFANYAGKPLVVNFFGSYCVPCVTEMPALEAAHQRYGDRVTFVGLDVSEPIAKGRTITDKTGVTYDLGRDASGSILRSVGGVNMPTTIFVAADGTIREIHSGQLTAEQLDQIINEKLLS